MCQTALLICACAVCQLARRHAPGSNSGTCDIILRAALSPKRVRQIKIRIPETHVLFLRLYIFHSVTGCRRRQPKVSLKKVHSG